MMACIIAPGNEGNWTAVLGSNSVLHRRQQLEACMRATATLCREPKLLLEIDT